MMLASRRILLIEDNMIAQMMAKELLVREGFQVDAACDGTDGVNLYRYYHYDLVILDIGLPDINGFEVAQRIRKLEQESNHPPVEIIALSASKDEYPQLKYKQAGINRIFDKPLQDNMVRPIFKGKNQ